MPPLFIVSSASHSGSSGARTGAWGGIAITSDARVDPKRRRPSRWSRRRPMMPRTRSSSTTGIAGMPSGPS